MKKITFLIISVIMLVHNNACNGYKPIYSLSNSNFKIENNLIKGNERLKIDHSEKRFEYLHPLILEDGSLISSAEIAPLFNIDFCSQLLWINQEKQFHHSKMLDSDRNIWVASKMSPYSKLVDENKRSLRFIDDSITKVNQKGEILLIKSVAEILIENGIFGERLFNLGILYIFFMISPSKSRVLVASPNLMVAIYCLFKECSLSTSLVLFPVHISKTPSAKGSKVPACPALTL